MGARNAVLLLWAVVATAAAVYLALQPAPTLPPEKPRAEPVRAEPPRSPRPRSAESFEAFLALALEPPAPEKEDDRPVAERVRALFEEYAAYQRSEDWNVRKDLEISRKLFALVAFDTEAHRALMQILATADDEAASDVLTFLVWNPFVKATVHRDVTRAIKKQAMEMIATDPSVARREAAVRVLFHYDIHDPEVRAAFEYGLDRLEAEPSVEVRDVLLEEMSEAGTRLGLTREEAAPFVGRLRARLEEGCAWCAVALADWSTDAEDFRRIRELLATGRRQDREGQSLVNALSGDKALVRDRSGEARALLIELVSDPTAHEHVRSLARSFLAETFGPMDAASTDAVRRYDAEREGR